MKICKKYKKELIITAVTALLVVFLRAVNVLQDENRFGSPPVMIAMTVLFSFLSIAVQKRMDAVHAENRRSLENLDLLKYVSAILIMILHLRPFAGYSDAFDLAFNNIVTRICVPVFFLITGYFAAKKEKENPAYIRRYIRKTIPLYLIWSALYIPVLIAEAVPYWPSIRAYLDTLPLSAPLMIPLFLVLIPAAVFAALTYTGVYYHLWYFPAVLLSLAVLDRWKKKYSIPALLCVSFILLLFGATETYWGIIPADIQQLLSYYYKIFFTTRNFLFFGLFYTVFGYYLGSKEKLYSEYCFEKLMISGFLLVFEAILLHDTERLNSNILLSCIPLVYYLFVSVIHYPVLLRHTAKIRSLSKYLYLIHPMVIFILSACGIGFENPFSNILLVLAVTHAPALILIRMKEAHRKLPLQHSVPHPETERL